MFQAEARLAAKRAARAEAREIRMKELERQQKEVMPTSSLVLFTGGLMFGRVCECGGTCASDTAHDQHALVPVTSVQGQAREGA